jgi:hypothetical protein
MNVMRAALVALIVGTSLGSGVAASEQEAVPYMPTAKELGEGVVMIEDVTRDLEDLAATFPDSCNAAGRLEVLKFRDQAERTFARGDATIDISIHVFNSPASTGLAVAWYAQERADRLGLKETEGPAQVSPRLPFEFYVPYSNADELTVWATPYNRIVRVTVTGPEAERWAIEQDVMTYVVNRPRGGVSP